MDYARVLKLPQYFRNLQRLSEILRVMVKHGFGDLVNRLNLAPYLESGIKLVFPAFPRQPLSTTFNTRVRLALEELGPTFIKLGQVISTRPDIFPVSLTFELRQLQDKVPPFPASESRKLIEQELGHAVEELFETFDDTPIAAASIAQVHRARLKSGDEVVVKVQRPNLDRILNTDVEILTGLASLIEERVPESRSWRPAQLVEEFSRSLKRECDFKREAQNIEIFGANFADEAGLLLPKVYRHLSTQLVLTEEFIDGIKTDDVDAIQANQIDRKKVSAILNRVVLRSIFEHGFFHADPHAGNILVTRDNRVALIDFGMMGRLEKTRLNQILQFLVALFSRDMNRVLRVLHETRIAPLHIDEVSLKNQLAEIIDHYLGQSFDQLNLSQLITDIFELVRRHGVKPPVDLLLIVKSITTLESIGSSLAPEFVPFAIIHPYLMERYFKNMTDPALYASYLSDVADSYIKLLGDLPDEFRVIVQDLARGDLKVKFEPTHLVEARKHQNQLVNRALYASIGATLAIVGFVALSRSPEPFHPALGYALISWGAILLFLVWRAVRRSGGLA